MTSLAYISGMLSITLALAYYEAKNDTTITLKQLTLIAAALFASLLLFAAVLLLFNLTLDIVGLTISMKCTPCNDDVPGLISLLAMQ